MLTDSSYILDLTKNLSYTRNKAKQRLFPETFLSINRVLKVCLAAPCKLYCELSDEKMQGNLACFTAAV